MRIKFLLIALLTSFIGFSQSVNDYKAVIVPLKYDFLKTENQYRMSTMTKSNLNKAGFQAFYANEQLPAGYGDRCDLLYVDVKRDNGFLVTKLFVELKDCYGKVIYTSEIGKSKEKDYEVAYRECLDLAFVSITGLHYKYSGKSVAPTVKAVPVSAAAASVATSSTLVLVAPSPDLKDPNLLYAQPTESGYQLIDKTPKVVMKLLKTSQTNVFIAIKDNVQGSLILKEDGNWYFESYQNDKLVSEKIVVKF
ncbi:hypothetical protein C8C83_2540 [Flavobacterium sp. 90]|uniref:hypothetical protein n=1 Tax=unclassified Flavobacterium TaxID=196869 RepID=UPI000EAF4992|nr:MULTISPECIES: hypothetical protein [unclassified Flavobacterium]RKR10848.1 hypothetical protein C8C82_2845 [Flavobacterium sp. 81]TCK54632.1 hypothetical protein C8C83_2540 [Flavobacterium sp. 90]